MVEFGLKLEDNKVSEWSDSYINYERLKAILKKAKAAQKKYDDQARRRPVESQKIFEAFNGGVTSYVTITPSTSSANLAVSNSTKSTPNQSSTNLVKVAEQSTSPDDDNKPEIQQPNETTKLLSSQSSALGFSLTDYFGSRYERHLRECLKDIETLKCEFDILIKNEIQKICSFYKQKLDELQRRLELLLDNVDYPANHNQLMINNIENNDNETEKKQQALLMNIVHRVSTMMKHGDGGDTTTTNDNNTGTPTNTVNVGDLSHHNDEDDDDDIIHGSNKALDTSKIAEADSIKRALVDQYRTAKLLLNYVIMNYTGIVKIVKKHDKTLPSNKGKYKSAIQAKNLCDEGKDVEELANKVEKYYADWFCEGNVREAHAQMLPKRGDGLEMDWSQLRLGYRMGMCAVLGMWVCWDCVWGLVADGNSTIGGRTAFPVFRACGGLLLLQWFWGCSVFVWTRYRVNYIYLFDFNPHIVSTALGIFEEAVDNTLIFLVIMLLYYKSGAHDIPEILPAGAYPFMLVVITILRLIFPLRTRMPMWNAIWQVVSAPLQSPNFFHGYVGDIFTSLVKVFQDVAWTTGYIVSGDFLIPEDLEISTKHVWSKGFWYRNVLIPVICLLPLIFRFNQCLRRYIDTKDRWPHLANAFKYALSQTVTLFGAFHPLYLEHNRPREHGLNNFQLSWLTIFISSSLYSFTWDVYMDWGLGRPKHGYLGPSLMYPKRSTYFMVISLDLGKQANKQTNERNEQFWILRVILRDERHNQSICVCTC